MLKIISWNIRQGGGTRYSSISKYLLESKADIIVLSEFQNNERGNAIRHALLNAKYFFQSVSTTRTGINAVLVASKHPFDTVNYAHTDYEYKQGVIKTSFEAFDVYGVYLPHKKKHKLFDLLLSETSEEKPSIITGDFNTGKNYIDQKGDSFWYTDKLEELHDQGFVDAFRVLHPEAKEYSWFSHQGNGYRYDHSYISQGLAPIVKSCFYDQEAREVKFSDHSPMILELG